MILIPVMGVPVVERGSIESLVTRLYGYFAVIAAIPLALLAPDSSAKSFFGLVWLLGFPLACLLDFAGRKDVLAPEPMADIVRISSFLIWTPAILLIMIFWGQIPEPLWRQGPDTSYAREKVGKMIRADEMKSLRRVYYY